VQCLAEKSVQRKLGYHLAVTTEPRLQGQAAELPLPEGFKLSVLMPTFNESRWISSVLDRVSSVPLPKEIILVDDGSTDGTREILSALPEHEYPDLRVALHDRNRGKGAAVRTGIGMATGDVCLIQDADLEGDPDEYLKLLRPILDGRADAVYGSRFAGAGERRVDTLTHYLANKVLTDVTNVLTNLRLTDMETCYKVVRTDLLKSLPLCANRFEIEPEITVKLARARARIYEVPVSYNPRDYTEGKKIGWRDGIHAVWALVKFRFLDA
jgi:glycosyltransferase involved in cell wall biosynthesis